MSSDGHFFDILINDKNKLERKFMFKKEERTGIIVYLYYNRDVKKIEAIGTLSIILKIIVTSSCM